MCQILLMCETLKLTDIVTMFKRKLSGCSDISLFAVILMGNDDEQCNIVISKKPILKFLCKMAVSPSGISIFAKITTDHVFGGLRICVQYGGRLWSETSPLICTYISMDQPRPRRFDRYRIENI